MEVEAGPMAAVVCTDDVAWVRAQPVFDGMHIRNGTDPAHEVRDAVPFSFWISVNLAGRTWRSSLRAST